MKTTVKRLSETKVELTISIDKAELEAAEKVALTKLSKKLKVAGFRKGRAPLAMVQKSLDPNTLQEETLNNALSKAVAEAFVSEKIQAIDRPAVEIKKFVPRQELVFTAESEVLPTVKLGDYKKLKTKLSVAAVTKQDVDEIVERMRQNFAAKTPTDKLAGLGDEVVIDFVGKKDGVAFEGGEAKGFELRLGGGQFIPGFEEGVVGHKTGDKFDLELKFPKEYHSKELAGQAVVFEVELRSVSKLELPEINDEFAAKCGPFTSATEMIGDIEREIGLQKEREAQQAYRDALISELAEKSRTSLPEILIADQLLSIQRDLDQNLRYQGLAAEDYYQTQGFKDEADWIEKQARPLAEKRVKIGLVLAELSKELKIDVTHSEVAEQIATLQRDYGKDQTAANQFNDPEVHRSIANRLLSDKAIEKLVEISSGGQNAK